MKTDIHGMNMPAVDEIAQLIDHAFLQPNLTVHDLLAGLDEAADLGVYSVCVQPANVALAVDALRDTPVRVGTVVGFPHGATTPEVKEVEAVQAVMGGATEVDMVLNIGLLRSGADDAVRDEIEAVVRAAKHAGAEIVKVIFETAYLSDEEIVRAAQLSEAAGADFIKTSTGFAGGGATLAHVNLMRDAVGKQVQVKASGGVRDLDTLLAMRDAGVTRFGTSASRVILDDLRQRLATGERGNEVYAADY